jgi:hypothetical protein
MSRKVEEGTLRESSTIEGLAQAQGVRLEEVRSLYESVLERIKEEAVIMDFLPIFAARRVRELLEERKSGEQPEKSEQST